MEDKNSKGKLYLIGAGPGDPNLMTLRGKECIRTADVIVYDYLANSVFLSWAKPEAQVFYMGKKGGTAHIQQEEINEFILQKVLAGKKVARLKGGDPFIFGRGGEEAEILAEQGIPFEIIPGITSAISVPAYAGIPLTHRRFASQVTFITGHEDPTKEESVIAWEKLTTDGAGTLVFLMGMSRLPDIVKQLQKHGLSPTTPVAVIQWGTRPNQRTLVADLNSVAHRVVEEGFGAPSIIVVGEVVRLREKLQWFEKRPLFGKTIVVTRARAQASEFSQRLTELGAFPIEFPTIRVSPCQDYQLLDEAIDSLSTYQWIIFTSVNGVDFFFQHLYKRQKDSRSFASAKVCAIGPETASLLQQKGIRADYVPPEYRAESIIDGLLAMGIKGSKILIPRAAAARDILPEKLKEQGALVEVVPVYETLPDEGEASKIIDLIKQKAITMITFTSTSTVKNFASAISRVHEDMINLLKEVDIACIGPICAKEAELSGLKVRVMPKEYTIAALTEAIVQYYQSS